MRIGSKKQKLDPSNYPTVSQLKMELVRENERLRFRRSLWNTIFSLVVVAAITVLVAVLWLPVLEIYGGSMSPTLVEGDVVVSIKTARFERGDVMAFYYGNKLLVKRVIGLPEEVVDIREDGSITVDGQELEENYIQEFSPGESDIEYPYKVPLEQYFVLGDHRETSLDSRSSVVGCVTEDQISGKVILRIWPLEKIGIVGK